MKVSTILAVAFAAIAAAAPSQKADDKDKTTRVEGINLTGMTEKEMQEVIAKMKKDPEIQAIMESINGTTNEEKMAVMNVAKKGLAYNNAGILGPFRGRASWAYNWGPALDAPDFQGIPMCWGGGNDCNFNGVFQKLDRGNTPFVLGFNEPDFPRTYGGSQMSPQQAYDYWGNDMFRFQSRGAQLVCPAISSYDTDRSQFTGIASGFTWLRQWALWRNTPDEFRCAAQALHWYGVNGMSGYDQALLFIDYMNRAHGTVNDIFRRDMPLWVTEFAPEPLYNADVLADFIGVAASWLNQQGWVHRYSPFMAETMVSGGGLNRAGNNFVNA